MLQKVTHAGEEDFAAVVFRDQRAHEVAQHFTLSVGHLSHLCGEYLETRGAANKSPAEAGQVEGACPGRTSSVASFADKQEQIGQIMHRWGLLTTVSAPANNFPLLGIETYFSDRLLRGPRS